VDGHEKAVIVEPGCIPGTELHVFPARLSRPEAVKSPVEEFFFAKDKGGEIDIRVGRGRGRGGFGIGQEAFSAPDLRADQQGIPGKGGPPEIGGVPAGGVNGAQGKNLPITLFGLGEKIGELVSLRPQVSDPIRGG